MGLASATEILDFWFSPETQTRWFDSTPEFDAQIQQKFEATAQSLANALPDAETQNSRGQNSAAQSWMQDTPEVHLARIITLDQLPRNMYRGTPRAFAWDGLALDAAKRLVDQDRDLSLSQLQRPFAYMPFMHSEDVSDQNRCVALCQTRLEDDNTLKFAILHRDIIRDFGRFPHRNIILGRQTTPDEQAFLDAGGFSG